MIPQAESRRTEQLRDNVPEAMRRRPQWVVWKLEDRDGKQTKVPSANQC